MRTAHTMRFRTSLPRPVASLSLAAALFVACSSAPVLDNDHLQQEVESGLATNGITATVTCPDNQAIRQGGTFNCQALTPDGLSLTILITMTDNTGQIDWKLVGS